MAISWSSLLAPEGTASSAQSSFTTSSSVSPTADTLVMCAVIVNSDSGAWTGSPTLSGGGMSSWTLHTTQNGFATGEYVFVFRSTDASPSSGALTFTAPASETATFIRMHVVEGTGTTISGTNAADAIVQTAGNSADTSATTVLTVTYGSAFAASTNGGLAFFAMFGGNRPSTPRSGWTESGDGHISFEATTVAHWRSDEDTAASATYSDTLGTKVGVALEIEEAGGGEVGSPNSVKVTYWDPTDPSRPGA